MEFVRQLEDSERALRRMGPNYSNRLDNEDVIVMLMKKLPDQSLKRKWADKAGDLLKGNGLVTFSNFVNFLKHIAGRINNRYGRELKLSNEFEKSPVTKQRLDQSRAIYSSATKNDLNDERENRLPRKCPQCSGPHGVWRCRVFKSASLEDRWEIVKQRRLCMICLDEGHFAKCCKSGFTCRMRGCGKGHHYLLHRDQNFVKDDRTNDNKGDQIKEQAQGQKGGVTQNDATYLLT